MSGLPSIKIVWTHHAIQRVAERFGFHADIEIPNNRIRNACKSVTVGDEFRIKTTAVTYVCKRDSERLVAIVTVLYS